MNQNELEIKTPEFVSLQFQIAGLGSRAAAFLIDQLLLMAVNALTILIIGIFTYFFYVHEEVFLPIFLSMNTVPLAIAIIVLFVLNWGYFFAYEFFSGGRTIGKKLVGIRVIQENGHSLTLLSSFIRNLLRIIDSLPASYFLGMIMIFFHSKHKRLGDVVAGTIVVRERKTKKKNTWPIEKEIQARGVSKDFLQIENWTLRTFTAKDWRLLNTYITRFRQLPQVEKDQLTKQIGEILLPKLDLECDGKTIQELENILLVLYIYLKEEWEFEL